ncbi:hypothetical protein EKN06_05165 [Croceicoccus ponticola]|uniref:DUF3035 domain-containing protein n=1 Tax=Croceicoccus ponticola TaxID=2217664 RepID=A0A437H1V5_9SPHN|nr:hypothetical protein [Croceicoccus ponticola]RVQ69559.1 hypothetical protein EKN06_05165 [Croceicoccus ponticola]
MLNDFNSHLSRALVTALTMAVLSGCAADTTKYPSLARRDAERMTGGAAVAEPTETAPATPAPPPADLPGKLAAIERAANSSHETFLSREAVARSRARAAAGSAPGTLSWSDAEVALSSLESARSDTMFSLADLDSLLATGAVSQADTGIPAGLPAIAASRERVAALVAAEDVVLAQLRGL